MEMITRLIPGTPLTAEAAAALENLELALIDGRGFGGFVWIDVVEAVVHEFACQVQGSCCCATARPIHASPDPRPIQTIGQEQA